MQIGFVGWADGRQHGPSHPPRLRPRGRRLRLGADAVKAADGHGATGAARSRSWWRSSSAPRAVWLMVPAGDPTAGDDRELSGCSPRATRSSTAATRTGRTSIAAPRPAAPTHGVALRRRRHHRRRLGPRGRLLHDGRRRARRRSTRLAPILDVLAPARRLAALGRRRRRPLREDGPQRRSSTG